MRTFCEYISRLSYLCKAMQCSQLISTRTFSRSNMLTSSGVASPLCKTCVQKCILRSLTNNFHQNALLKLYGQVKYNFDSKSIPINNCRPDKKKGYECFVK